MSKKQTRVSISVKAEVHERLFVAAESVGMSRSAFVEDAVQRRCAELGIAEIPRAEALARVAARKAAAKTEKPWTDPRSFFPGSYG